MKMDQTATAKPEKLKASRAYSVATPAMDKSRREPLKANNPGSIPTAGGRALGQGAREERERRKSRMSSDMEMPPLDKEGSPDPTTQNNTQANTIPQRMNENGEGSSKVEEDRPVSAPAPDVTVTGADAKEETVTTPPAAAPAQDTVADLPAAKENNTPAPASKERRGSRLDDVLGKLKLGGKKSK